MVLAAYYHILLECKGVYIMLWDYTGFLIFDLFYKTLPTDSHDILNSDEICYRLVEVVCIYLIVDIIDGKADNRTCSTSGFMGFKLGHAYGPFWVTLSTCLGFGNVFIVEHLFLTFLIL